MPLASSATASSPLPHSTPACVRPIPWLNSCAIALSGRSSVATEPPPPVSPPLKPFALGHVFGTSEEARPIG